jgi:hypothetical protein
MKATGSPKRAAIEALLRVARGGGEMMFQPTLADRAARCRAWADAGNACAMVVGADELEEARALVEGHPVIVATGEQLLRFLRVWMSEAFEGRGRRRR